MSSNQGRENRTGPAGRTGPTGNRTPGRSGLHHKTGGGQNRSKTGKTGQNREKSVNRTGQPVDRFCFFFFLILEKNTIISFIKKKKKKLNQN